jgi:hypothetical protein
MYKIALVINKGTENCDMVSFSINLPKNCDAAIALVVPGFCFIGPLSETVFVNFQGAQESIPPVVCAEIFKQSEG